MAKGIDETITDMATPWEGYVKGRVEEFIKGRLTELESGLAGRVGWTAMSTETNERGHYELLCFASREAHDAWMSADDREAGDVAALLLERIEIPISTEQADVVLVTLARAEGQGASITALDGNVTLRLTLTSSLYSPADKSTTDYGEQATVRVQRRVATGGEWTEIHSGLYSPGELAIDISDKVSDDIGYAVRAMATGVDSGKSSVWVNFTVMKTAVALELATDTDRVQTPANGMQLQFRHTGAVKRTLHVEAYDLDGETYVKQTLGLGTSGSGDTAVAVRFADSTANRAKVTTGGAHRVRAWIAVDGSEAATEPLEAMVLMGGGSKVAVALNGVAAKVTNWAGEDALRWSASVPAGATDAQRAVRFTLESSDGKRTYWSTESMAVDSTGQTLTVTPEIEDVEAETIAARLRVYIGGGSAPAHDIPMLIDNSMSLAPTAGADFILDPRGRDNATSPTRFINAATGESVEATVSGIAFGSLDGWVSDDEGQKCLRVPAGGRVTIDYAPFTDFGAASGEETPGLTVEMDVATRNISDPAATLLRIAADTPVGGSSVAVGWELRGLDAAVMTSGNTTLRNQDIGLEEGRRTHIALNIVPALRSAGGKTLNVVRVFVDGVNTREFSYTGKGVLTAAASAPIEIGGEGADIDVYGIRVYRRALGKDEILSDRIAALPTVARKLAARAANDILTGGKVSYELAREKYDTLLWRGGYATYGNTKKDRYPGELTVSILGDPAHSGTLTAMTEKGQGTSSMTYYKWNGQFDWTDATVWTDGNGEEHRDGYRLGEGLPAARKLVGKVNYASSPQSHKMGSCNLYNDLWRQLTEAGSISGNTLADDPAVRVAVPQRPFLLFVQGEGDAAPRFEGLMTFGPGKGDKPTFGFDAEARPGYLCVEGADNNMPLLMHRVPWTVQEVTLEDGEDFMYDGSKQLSVVGGAVTEGNIARFREAFNFVYRHYPDLRRFEGDAAMLQMSAEADTQAHYWLDGAAAGAARYDVMRHDPVSGRWVAAGDSVNAAGEWGRVNLATDPVTAGAVNAALDGEGQNEAFVAARARHFKEHLGEHFNVTELLYTMSFCKLIAASDNRGKNTYLYTDPQTGLIGFQQDDLDTIFATNNTGQREKPYWVEEHDTNESGAMYWNSERNGLYNATEAAYDAELRRMTGDMLTAMRTLAGGAEPMECAERYWFRPIEEAFPAVAYNETAELRYEDAALSALTAGGYSNGTDPLSQSLGNQLGAERQWMRRRIDYLASWAGWGPYASADGEGAYGALIFRSVTNIDGTNHDYTVELTAHNAMYPAFALGQTVTRGTADGTPRRLMEGETGTFRIGVGDGETNIAIDGADNVRDLGDWTDMALDGNLTVNAARLRRFRVDGSARACQFRATGLTLATPLLEGLTLRGASTVAGTLDLGDCPRLRTLDLRGTAVSELLLPDGARLEELRLPATLTSLTMRGATVTRLSVEGAGALQSLTLDGSDEGSVRTLLERAVADSAPLTRVSVGKVAWTSGVSLAVMRALAMDAAGTGVSGRIHLAALTTNVPTFADKVRWITLWGNIDDPANALHVTYVVYETGGVSIAGDTMPMKSGPVELTLRPSRSTGNDIAAVEWGLTLRGGARATLGAATPGGARVNVAEVTEYAGPSEIPAAPPEAEVTATVTYQDGTVEEVTAVVACYSRPAVPGDYVFYDATYGPRLTGKTVVGVCFYVDPDDPTRRLCVAVKPIGYYAWGVYESLTLSNGGDGLNPEGVRRYSIHTSLTDSMFLNEDGSFKAFSPSDSYGRGEIGWTALAYDRTDWLKGAAAGAMMPWGQANTLNIIAHRDSILGDESIQLPTPSQRADTLSSHDEWDAFNACQTEAAAAMAKAASYYFPAASACYHWQPTSLKDGERLAECLTRNHWFLPSVGEGQRFTWQLNTALEEHRVFDKGASEGVFASPGTVSIWLSNGSASGSGNAMRIYIANGLWQTSNYGRKETYQAWPVAVF